MLLNLLHLDAVFGFTRVVDRYDVRFATPPTATTPTRIPLNRPNPPTGAYAGNGDVSLLHAGNGTNYVKKHTSASLDWQQWLYLSKNDIWVSDAKDYYVHMSAGRVGIHIDPAGGMIPSINGTVSMSPGNASISSSLVDAAGGNAAVHLRTRVLENNVILTTLVCTSIDEAKGCTATFLLSDTDKNFYGLAQQSGASSDSAVIWWRKENLHATLNPAYLGSCDPRVPLQSVERRFTVGGADEDDLRMFNQSCLWPSSSGNGTSAVMTLTSGSCDEPNGHFKWIGGGHILHVASNRCLSTSLKLVACVTTSPPWKKVPSGGNNASVFYIAAATGDEEEDQCMIVVPDNNNNTLGVALGLAGKYIYIFYYLFPQIYIYFFISENIFLIFQNIFFALGSQMPTVN